jgi:hypothetical protein
VKAYGIQDYFGGSFGVCATTYSAEGRGGGGLLTDGEEVVED